MKKFILTLMAVLLVLSLCACGIAGGQNGFALRNIIKNSGVFSGSDMDDIEVVTSVNLTKAVDGLSYSKNTQLLLMEYELFDNEDSYMICAVNYDSKNLSPFEYGSYFPLTAIYEGCINKMSERKHIDNFKLVYTFIDKYGFNCFDKQNICEEYITRLISDGNLITLNDARGAIEAALPQVMDDYSSYDDVKVIYKDGSAIPLYYAYKSKSVERNPNWGSINADSLTASQMEYYTNKFGPLMTEQTTWKAMDSEFNEMDSFSEDTFEGLEAALLNPESDLYQDNSNTVVVVQPDPYPPAPYYVPPQVSTPDYSTQSDSWYRVRKSAGDAQSQIGAFKVFSNAKNLADQRRSEGYEVYDTHGNLVYMP